MIQNKVADSELVTLDLKTMLPFEIPVVFDLKEFLFQGLILKEKNYRESLKQTDWLQFKDKNVLIHCSADVIIPVWAYMLPLVYLKSLAKEVFFDTIDSWREKKIIKAIHEINMELYVDRRVVIKGCGEERIPDSAFFHITNKLLPFVKSLMYGEPCSTVPVFKK